MKDERYASSIDRYVYEDPTMSFPAILSASNFDTLESQVLNKGAAT